MGFSNIPSIAEVLRNPGFLYRGATALSNESGWGQQLGFLGDGANVNIRYEVEHLRGEETGVAIIKSIYLGTHPVLTCIFKNWNKNVLNCLFPGLAHATQSYARGPNNVEPGTDMDLWAENLLFVPKNRVDGVIVLFQKTIPAIGGPFTLERKKDTAFLAVFETQIKTTDEDGHWYVGPIGNAVIR